MRSSITQRRLSVRILFLTGLLLAGVPLATDLFAQGPGGGPGARPMINLPDDPALRGFRWREIGPTGQGGRIDDFAADEKNPSAFFIGFAVSGVWRTLNNGTTVTILFYTTVSDGEVPIATDRTNCNSGNSAVLQA